MLGPLEPAAADGGGADTANATANATAKKIIKTNNSLIITKDNWLEHLGGCGLYGLGADHNFDAYRNFFQLEIERTSAEDTLKLYFPTLIKGFLGDFFHALIELGYYFESGNVDILPNALAWLSTSYVEVSVDETVDKMESTALTALRAASSRDDESLLPKNNNLANGSSGYIHDMETLLSDEYLAAVSRFDIAIPPERTQEVLMQLQEAARESFAAGGYKDFYTLHSVTGARAVWAIMNGGVEWDSQVECDMLSMLWKGVLLTHIARNNPIVKEEEDGIDSQMALDLVPWAEILEWTVATENSHIVKVIFTFADFYDMTGDMQYWQAAMDVMQTRKAGTALEGTGVGTFIDEYVQKYARE